MVVLYYVQLSAVALLRPLGKGRAVGSVPVRFQSGLSMLVSVTDNFQCTSGGSARVCVGWRLCGKSLAY